MELSLAYTCLMVHSYISRETVYFRVQMPKVSLLCGFVG